MVGQLKHHHMSTINHGKHLRAPRQPHPVSLGVNAVLGGRVQELIQSGAVTPGHTLLDITPLWEREKAWISRSLHVPLLVEDKDNSPIPLSKKWVHFGYVGPWTRQYSTMMNPCFLGEMESKLGWLAGEFNQTSDEDFPSLKVVRSCSMPQFGVHGITSCSC